MEKWSAEKIRRVMAGLERDADVQLDARQIQEILSQEMEKSDTQMDTALIDACCEALDALSGRGEADDAAPDMPLSLRRRLRQERTPGARMGRLALRAAAVAACVMLVLFGADVTLNRRAVQIAQSDDQQQALISFGEKSAGSAMVQHADANADNAFERVYLAPSLPMLWHTAGYTLPLPEELPEEMTCVQAYLLPMGSVDMITVVYAGGHEARVKVQYWTDDTRERVLLGYEKWPDRTEVRLKNGGTVLRFPRTDQNSGQLNAAFIAPHMTCAVTGENISEAEFAVALDSMSEMKKSAPPQDAYFDPQGPLALQENVTEYAPPQLHFYSREEMASCVRMEVPLPEYLPEGLDMTHGEYVPDDDWESVIIRAQDGQGGFMIYQYEVYGPDMADGLNMGVEQNEEGRRVTLQNGREAYIACNVDVHFGILAGESSMISVHLSGYDEKELMNILESIGAMPDTF